MAKKLPPITPGTILKNEFMDELGLNVKAMAAALGVYESRVSKIVRGEQRITADTAMRLSAALGTTAEFWMNLQSRYDLQVAEDQWPEIKSSVTKISA